MHALKGPLHVLYRYMRPLCWMSPCGDPKKPKRAGQCACGCIGRAWQAMWGSMMHPEPSTAKILNPLNINPETLNTINPKPLNHPKPLNPKPMGLVPVDLFRGSGGSGFDKNFPRESVYTTIN